MVIMAAANEAELTHMVSTAVAYDDGPSAFRYPRGAGFGVERPSAGKVLEIGKGYIVQEGTKVAILSLGGRLNEAMKAAKLLEVNGISTTVADARFAKPLDTDLIERLAKEHEVLLTIEEGSSGGFGASVLTHLAQVGKLQSVQQYTDARLMSVNIVNTAMNMLSLGTGDVGLANPLHIQKIHAAE